MRIGDRLAGLQRYRVASAGAAGRYQDRGEAREWAGVAIVTERGAPEPFGAGDVVYPQHDQAVAEHAADATVQARPRACSPWTAHHWKVHDRVAVRKERQWLSCTPNDCQ